MESTREESDEGLAVVRVLAAVLDSLVEKSNTQINNNDPSQVTKFHALQAPGINILEYLERVRVLYSKFSLSITFLSHVFFILQTDSQICFMFNAMLYTRINLYR